MYSIHFKEEVFLNNKLDTIINYLKDGSNYDKINFINNLAKKCSSTMGISPDELDIRSGSMWTGDLDDFSKEFYDQVIDSICNVIESYKE